MIVLKLVLGITWMAPQTAVLSVTPNPLLRNLSMPKC
jgi:hypothetical protein